jgi:hypothetical protein
MNSQDVKGFDESLTLPKHAPGVGNLPTDERDPEGVRHFLAMRRGLRYLMAYVTEHLRSGLTNAAAMDFAHQVTRPELLRDPALGDAR